MIWVMLFFGYSPPILGPNGQSSRRGVPNPYEHTNNLPLSWQDRHRCQQVVLGQCKLVRMGEERGPAFTHLCVAPLLLLKNWTSLPIVHWLLSNLSPPRRGSPATGLRTGTPGTPISDHTVNRIRKKAWLFSSPGHTPSRLCCNAISGEVQLDNVALADNVAGQSVSAHLLRQGGPVPILDHQVVVTTVNRILNIKGSEFQPYDEPLLNSDGLCLFVVLRIVVREVC